MKEYVAPTAIYVEVGGGAGLSLNIDQLVYEYDIYKASVRVGGGLSPLTRNGKLTLVPSVPVEVLGFIGPENKNVEFGFGYSHIFTSVETETRSYFTSRLGFRYQNPKGGYIVRAGIIPLLYQDRAATKPGKTISPGFALSVGKSF